MACVPLLLAGTAWSATAPTAVSGYPTGITATGVTFNGTASAGSADTRVRFQYGKSTSYGSSVAASPSKLPAGTGVTAESRTITGLACGTTYHYRIKAASAVAVVKGADRSFTTLACAASTAPVATTGAASNLSTTGATLAGSVTAGSASATVSFDYGTSTAYGSSAAATPSPVSASTTATSVSAALGSLACGTTYHYRVKAVSSAGTATGTDAAFTTLACAAPAAPKVTTGPASGVSTTGASLSGSVAPDGAVTTPSFEYGTTTSYGATASATPSPIDATAGTTSVASAVGSLACGTTYHYRAKATNSAGTAAGADQSFATTACGSTAGSGSAGSLRVSVGGFGYVSSSGGEISCGSVPSGVSGSSSRCFATNAPATVSLTATPFNANFKFAGWAGDTTCTTSPCSVDVTAAKSVRAKFVPVSTTANVCTGLGLVGDKANHPLNGNYPTLALLQSFVDPNFGTTIRKITDVTADGRGANTQEMPVYSTISAWNADESYLFLYRRGGSGSSVHELFDGKTYRFIRKLDDLPYADIEQVYWDTTKPNIMYGASMTSHVLYRYDVNAPAGQRLTALHDFTAQCGTKDMTGGSDPFFNSWDSKLFGLACAPNGAVFGYNAATDTLTQVLASEPRATSYDGPQASPSATKLFLNQPKGSGLSGNAVRLYDANMNRGAFLDMNSGDEHAGSSLLFNGQDTYNAAQFDPGDYGTGNGSIVQWNMTAAPNASNRIVGRVIVGPSTGYPYPPHNHHISGTAFNRTGLLAESIEGSMTGATLLDDELLYVDSDPSTNPANSVCRVGHHRTKSDDYFAEPHPSLSPSGTRIVFGSSWGSTSTTPVVNAYVVELPGYRP